MVAIRSIALLGWALACGSGAGSVEAQARADASGATAARDLPRGWVLEAEDVVFAEGAVPASGPPIGWMTRRVVTMGEPLRSPTVAPAELIRSGDDVQVVWSAGGIELRIAGRAMNSAAPGERVLVRVDGRRRFEGVASEAGVVHLDPTESSRQR